MHKIRRRPKQNFKIGFEEILNSELHLTQKLILIKTLQFHKDHCKYEYKNLLNIHLYKELNVSEPTMINHRQSLINDKFFEIKKIRVGKSFLLEYRFKWTKLLKLKFIHPIEKNEYTPNIMKKSKPLFEEGHILSKNDIPKFKDDKVYEVKKYQLDNNGNRKGNGIIEKQNGKSLKFTLNIQDRTKEFEYVFIQII